VPLLASLLGSLQLLFEREVLLPQHLHLVGGWLASGSLFVAVLCHGWLLSHFHVP